MSSFELTYWMEFFQDEPWGFEVDNFRMGVIAATVANVAPRKDGEKALKPSDFYPSKRQGPIVMTPRQRAELAKRRAKAKKHG